MRRVKDNDISEYRLAWAGESDRSIKVRTHEDASAVWLPKSQIEYERCKSIAVVQMPDWLAIEKGIV